MFLRARQAALTLLFAVKVIAFASAFSLKAWGQEPLPGFIPRFYSIEAATDLPLSAEQAHRAALQGQDISRLEPNANTNIWSPHQNTIREIQLIHPGEKLLFTGELQSRDGIFRFSVQNSRGEDLVIYLSKKAHNLLLRKNILEKVGYNVPAMSWSAQMHLTFKDTIDEELFFIEMKDKLLGSHERFIKKRNTLSVDLQDVLVFTSQSDIYNLSLGIMNQTVHQGRRLLRAAYVPIALVDTPESVNLMPWQSCRLVMNQIKLYHTLDIQPSFGTSFEDAKWIGRRIGQLNRNDFEEIVAKSYYPAPVAALLTEKIVARRNDLLLNCLELKEFTPLPFEPNLSMGPQLVDGKLQVEFFDGFASRFSYGDPESPFNASEMGSYVLSRVQNLAFQNALATMNKLLRTNDNKNYTNAVIKALNKNPFRSTAAIIVPSFQGNVILSRDIVAGSYLGTNHKVQLVDNLGFNLDAGIIAGIEGLPAPLRLSGKASFMLQRVYSHVKPLESLKKSMREPYKNLLVPLLINEIAQSIDSLDQHNPDHNAQIAKVITDLKKSIQVGESFIVTDSVVPSLNARLTVDVSQIITGTAELLEAYAEMSMNRLIISRFHFFRASENVFHIYQDNGKGLQLIVSFGLNGIVPILKFQGRWNSFEIETLYYPLHLSPDNATAETLKALRNSLLKAHHKPFQDIQKPHRIEHKIKERIKAFQFFLYKKINVGSSHQLEAHHSQGGARFDITRRYDAKTDGFDKESFAIDTVNEFIEKILKIDDFSINTSPVINPGFTVEGSAKNRIYQSEFHNGRFATQYERVFNGWRASKNKLQSLIQQLNSEAGHNVFNPLQYKDVSSVLLYKVQLMGLISEEGSRRLIQLTDAQLRNLVASHSIQKKTFEDAHKLVNTLSSRLKLLRKKDNFDRVETLKMYHDVLDLIFSEITLIGIKKVMGDENLVIQARIDGFRQNDENGDSPILSDVHGTLPLPLQIFPSQKVMQSIGILEGELFGHWLTTRAL